MGDIVYPPPSEFPPGTDCDLCTPALYAPGNWPSILYATFYGMAPCEFYPEPPNGHPFLLYQRVNPCLYSTIELYAGTHYYCHFKLADGELRLINEDLPYGGLFWGTGEPCSFDFPENLLTCPSQGAEGGTGQLSETPTPLASLLCSSYGLMPWGRNKSLREIAALRTRTESQDVAMDHTLIRLANRRDKSRLYVYFDDEDLPQ